MPDEEAQEIRIRRQSCVSPSRIRFPPQETLWVLLLVAVETYRVIDCRTKKQRTLDPFQPPRMLYTTSMVLLPDPLPLRYCMYSL